jgi:hypothetical protein
MVKSKDKYEIVDVGKNEDFSFEKYIDGSKEIHIVGQKRDLELIKKRTVEGEDKLIDVTL